MKTYQKVLIGIGAALVVLVAAVIFIFSWEGSPKKIVATADQFKVPTSWELTSERVKNPRIICLMGDCSSLSRVWEYDDPLTNENLLLMLQEAGWAYTFEDDRCRTMGTNQETDLSYICVVNIVATDFDGSIYIERESTKKYTIYLDLGPK